MLNCFKKITCLLLVGAVSSTALAAQTVGPYTSYSRYDEQGLLLGHYICRHLCWLFSYT